MRASQRGRSGRRASSRHLRGRRSQKGGVLLKEETCKKCFDRGKKGVRHTVLRKACKLGYPAPKSRVAAARHAADVRSHEEWEAKQKARQKAFTDFNKRYVKADPWVGGSRRVGWK